MFRGRHIGFAAQPRIDMAGGFLAMADRNRNSAFGGHHIATCKNTGNPRHHIGTDLDHAVLDFEAWHPLQQRQIDILAEREHN